MATWPLPNIKPSGIFTLTPIDQTVRTEMDVGTPRVRRRTTARNDTFTTSWVMQDAEVEAFRSWHDTSIAGGASWFTIDLPLGSTIPVSATARFKTPFTIDHIGGTFWKISGTLEIRV